MQYLPLFLLFMAVLIAAYFYLERAKARTTNQTDQPKADATVADGPPAGTPARPAEPDSSKVPPTDLSP